MSRLNIVANFLNELNSMNVKETFGVLQTILETLETKGDPDPLEIEIVDVGYQVMEKLNLLEAALRKYVTNKRILTGNKLHNLYEGNNDESKSSSLDD
jgi:hypothetical protein